MSVLYLVSCTASKAPTACAAEDLYTSDWFLKARRYLASINAEWKILSALHGLVEREAVVEPYNLTLKAQPRQARKVWARKVATQIWTAVPAGTTLVWFAGKAYREDLIPLLGSYRSLAPLASLGIGRQLAWFMDNHGKGAV